ncbi:MAG: ATP-binding protein [Gammaproteobacteria bacterium]|nr:ATP-binding protein [Gammaproteobacteria bacterium]MDH5486918.1 ATP-binding protein [Gammaproteobacteria bacterium]
MESNTLNRIVTRYVTGFVPLAVLSVLLITAFIMMNAAAQNSALFGRLYSVLLLVNILGVVLLIALILLNLFHFVEQYRARVIGTRLTLRLLIMFVVLAVVPVSVVFYFSIQALNRGIDNWFDVRIERALDDALLLGRTALDAQRQDLVKNAQEIAIELETLPVRRKIATVPSELSLLNALREQYNITELTLYTQDRKILASSSEANLEASTLVPARPSDAMIAQVRQGLTYANLDAISKSGLRLRVVVPVQGRDVGAPIRVLQVLQALPPRYAKLGESVQSAFAEYEKLVYLRGPLKFGFTLTLSLIALLTLLIAVWAAIFFARRLATPIRELAEATNAVAQGDYQKQIPVTSHDEIGILVESFNDMTRRIHRAQLQSKRSQQEAEIQRAYLETVLGHLSSGVLTFNQRLLLRTHNPSAGQILGADLRAGERKSLGWLVENYPSLRPLIEAVEQAAAAGQEEWQSQIQLTINKHRRILLLRGTSLPSWREKRGGYVVVFDDITALIQAQRDAAWGEVARRMAHEIKNPLTPIQLSAERIRHKFLRQVTKEDRHALERATRTIIEQVDSLKSMVNDFSEYARSAQMLSRAVDVNDLIRDVVELYKNTRSSASVVPLRDDAKTGKGKTSRAVTTKLDLDADLPQIPADPGRLRQVLHNLLLNSRDALAATAKPVIRINTRVVGENVHRFIELTVQDNGPGFPEALLARLYEPYVTHKEKGTGLGLAIVKRIVEEHGGTIRAYNLKDGGACVVMRLPVTTAAAAGPAPAPAAAQATRGENKA